MAVYKGLVVILTRGSVAKLAIDKRHEIGMEEHNGSLKELLEAADEHLKEYFEVKFVEAEKALRLKAEDYDSRIAELRRVQQEVVRDLREYLKTTVYDVNHESLRRRLEQHDAEIAGLKGSAAGSGITRTWIIAALAISLAISSALIALHNYLTTGPH